MQSLALASAVMLSALTAASAQSVQVAPLSVSGLRVLTAADIEKICYRSESLATQGASARCAQEISTSPNTIVLSQDILTPEFRAKIQQIILESLKDRLAKR